MCYLLRRFKDGKYSFFFKCSRKRLQLPVPISIFDDSQSLAYGILLGLCFCNCLLWRDVERMLFKSLTSSLIDVSVLWFNIDSTLQRNVDKHSSVNNLSRLTTFREGFTDFTRHSHIPNIQEFAGRLDFHCVLFAARCLLTDLLSISLWSAFNYFETPIKFVSLSDLIMFTLSLLQMNLLSPSMNTSVERSPAIPKWTIFLAGKQVNRATHLFAVAWLDLDLLESLMW